MAHEINPRPTAPAVEHRFTDPHAGEPTLAPEPGANPGQGEEGTSPEAVGEACRGASRRLVWLGWAVAVLAVCAVTLFISLRAGTALPAANGGAASSADGLAGGGAAGIPVNTVRPRQKTLERILVLPGSIQPGAQAELYAKASGYLKSIQRAPTPQLAADLAAQGLTVWGPPIVRAARLAVAAQLALAQAPQKDIGSPVRAGELLLEIATPERQQSIVEKESLLEQYQAELEAARTALATFQAAVLAVQAQKVQAEAEVRKCASEHLFRTQELKRLKELVESRTVTQEIADEKQHQVNAALAAWDSSRAKVQAVQAELAVVSSKLAAARADLRVREVRIQVARDDLRQAHILADYSLVRAPFDGLITYRGVDEGDFIQNATSGQARRLMTITALDWVKVVLHVPERDAPWVRVGTETTMVVDALPDTLVKGRVVRIAHALDPQTRTMQAEIDLDNRDRQLLPGMYGEVTVLLQKIPNAQAIPATALYSRKGENYIIQVRDGIAHRQRVRIRYDDGKEVEVLKLIGGRPVPLDGSEEVIVSNKGEIAEGQRVRTAQGPAGHARGVESKALREEAHEQANVNHRRPALVAPAAPLAGRLGAAGRLSPRPPA
ncbi:MAG: efflux RND transporter periplasmic adaptor subunit [Gemmataceae bacterium]|nr:efflux RND transporter periplasmic adaptor subunit [Gemmataceae bacterium]